MPDKSSWTKPKTFDDNLVVIGAGAGGLVSAYIAAALKAKVTLIEKNEMGGDCLNTGCVPSKAFIRSAKLLADIQRASDFGIRHASADFDFADIMERVQATIRAIAPHDSVERYAGLGVNVLRGEAKIVSPWQIEVSTNSDKRTIASKAIIISAGAGPFKPALPGIELVHPLTSDNIWSLRELPKRLLVLGGGAIGCELAQSFARFGSKVTLVDFASRLLAREDKDVTDLLEAKFRSDGIDLHLNSQAKSFVIDGDKRYLLAESDGRTVKLAFDQVLLALGRSPNISGYGCEELNIRLNPNNTIAVDPFQATNYPSIYAVGDVAGPFQFTHTAAHQAWYAAVNALFSPVKLRTDYSVIPWATFTDPEVARVGLNQQEAEAKAIPHEVTTYSFEDLDRAIVDGETTGFVKVLTPPGKDRILGVTIVGEHAGDLLAEFVLAMKHGIGLNKLLSTIHIYPTYSEAAKYSAGNWKKHHAPEFLLPWLERFHSWRRNV